MTLQLLLVVILLLMTACAVPVKIAEPVATPQPDTPFKSGGIPYQIDLLSSQVTIEISKAGTHAYLGHNHLLSVKELQGEIHRYDTLEGYRIFIWFPVSAIEVDPDFLRKQAGERYKKVIGEKDKLATYRNMLSQAVLDVVKHPFISLESIQINNSETNPIMITAIQIKGQTRILDIPINLNQFDARLCANGTFTVLQSEFGIKPFSILMGAVKIADELVITFKLCANRQE